MQAVEARERLLAVAFAEGDIAEGALWLAAEDCPGVEPAPHLERIDCLAAELRARCGKGGCRPHDAPLVAALLRDRLHLHGAAAGDPRSHYLHTVLQRGAGIPIACSALWIAVGRRAHLPVAGVNMPGHFIVRVGHLLYDTVSGGEPLDADATRRLVAGASGCDAVQLEPGWLATASTREMLARMSRNLRGLYAGMERWDAALRAADRCVDLMPEDPRERRDRGFVLWRMGRPIAALADLRSYLETAADPPDRGTVEEAAARLRAYLN